MKTPEKLADELAEKLANSLFPKLCHENKKMARDCIRNKKNQIKKELNLVEILTERDEWRACANELNSEHSDERSLAALTLENLNEKYSKK